MKSNKNLNRIAFWLLTFVFGVSSLYFEFQNTKEDHFFYFDVIRNVTLLFLFVLGTGIQIKKDISFYRANAKLTNFLYSLILVSILCSLFVHKYLYSEKGFGITKFTAYNYRISHGVFLDFKTNRNLKIVEYNKFGETNYWGEYTQSGDTLLLDITTDFTRGKIAYIKNDTLRFIGDTTSFAIEYPKYQQIP